MLIKKMVYIPVKVLFNFLIHETLLIKFENKMDDNSVDFQINENVC